MKNPILSKSKNSIPFLNRENNSTYSTVVDEVLQLTFPNLENLFDFKKKEFYRLIERYFFHEELKLFQQIETFSNSATAQSLRGFQLLIKKNKLTSFAALDQYMSVKKARSFAWLNQSLAAHEVLGDEEKARVIGGRIQKNALLRVSLNLHCHAKQVMIA